MIKVKEIYRCQICGNTVKVIQGGAGTLICCGQPMSLIKKVSLKQTKKIA